MSNYWGYLAWSMYNLRRTDKAAGQPGIKKGMIYFMPTGSVDRVADIDFFTLRYRFIEATKNHEDYKNIWSKEEEEKPYYAGELNRQSARPNIWMPADTLAKAAYSTVLADLGQSEIPNIFTNETSLEYYTANFTSIRKHLKANGFGPEHDPFDAQHSTSGPLRIVPSVIRMRYLCQVPQIKSTGKLIVSVMIADLVLLQAAWQLFKLLSEWLVTRKDRNALCCSGCAVNPGCTSPNSSSVALLSGPEASTHTYVPQRLPGTPASRAYLTAVPQQPVIGSADSEYKLVAQDAADAPASPAYRL
jgi:hypothetical protein